jgi:hypothetical protein
MIWVISAGFFFIHLVLFVSFIMIIVRILKGRGLLAGQTINMRGKVKNPQDVENHFNLENRHRRNWRSRWL